MFILCWQCLFLLFLFLFPWNSQRSVCFCLLSSPVIIVYMCMHVHAYHEVCVCVYVCLWWVGVSSLITPPYKLRQGLLAEPRITPSDSLAAQVVPDFSSWVLGLQVDHYPPVIFVGFGDHSELLMLAEPSLQASWFFTLFYLSVCLLSVHPSIHLSIYPFPRKGFYVVSAVLELTL